MNYDDTDKLTHDYVESYKAIEENPYAIIGRLQVNLAFALADDRHSKFVISGMEDSIEENLMEVMTNGN